MTVRVGLKLNQTYVFNPLVPTCTYKYTCKATMLNIDANPRYFYPDPASDISSDLNPAGIRYLSTIGMNLVPDPAVSLLEIRIRL